MKTAFSKNISSFLIPKAKVSAIICCMLALASCNNSKEKTKTQVLSQTILKNVRLADGVPLNIQVSTRWEIENESIFKTQFKNRANYDSLVLFPRELELANNISNRYNNVDSVFTSQRHVFINNLKTYLTENLGEKGIKINEVIVADVVFPVKYTNAKEKLAMQDQELKRIRKQSLIELQATEARKEQTKAQGEVDMEKALTTAKVEKINAKTEESRRKSMLARAETEKQVAEKKAESDARRKVLLARAELEKMNDLKNLEVQKKKDFNKLALENKFEIRNAEFNNDIRMAKLCNDNPVYAKYMINKELASKVKIAVVPAGENKNVFSDLLNK